MNFSYVVLLICFFLVFLCWYYGIRQYLKKRSFYKWLEKNPHYKKIHEIEIFLTALYENTPSYKPSSNEEQQVKSMNDDFIYGEINLVAFLEILAVTKPTSGEIFYDLGSGSGKAVFAAALFGDFSKLYGIELLPGLHKIAQDNIRKANELLRVSSQSNIKVWQSKISCIQFMNANFLDYSFADANIVFINATCFGFQTWQSIIEKLLLLKAGSRVIVHTKKIQHAAFKLIHESRELASWGDCAVHVYVKRNCTSSVV